MAVEKGSVCRAGHVDADGGGALSAGEHMIKRSVEAGGHGQPRLAFGQSADGASARARLLYSRGDRPVLRLNNALKKGTLR